MAAHLSDKHDFFGELYSWALLQPQSPIITTWLAWARVRLREMETEFRKDITM